MLPIIEFWADSAFLPVALTIVAFTLGSICQNATKVALFNPILIGSLIVMLALKTLRIPYETYQDGCRPLTYLITPATICLAISFAEQLQSLKKYLPAILIGVLAGTLSSIGLVWAMVTAFGFEEALAVSLLPKSVTSAIAVALSEQAGGIGSLTMAAVTITGIIGNMIGPALCKSLKLTHPVAQGVALGTSSHVVGTSRAMTMSQLAGAVSGLSLTLSGILTSLVFSLIFA